FTDVAPAAPVTSCTGQPNGTLCDDGNPCTEGEKCQNQNCVGGNPAPAGTICSDANACTTGDHCDNKVCVGTPITCTASDQCHNATTYTPTTAGCANPNKTDGTACNDGNACTQTDTCQNGTCTGSNPVVCTADQCHDPGTCNT